MLYHFTKLLKHRYPYLSLEEIGVLLTLCELRQLESGEIFMAETDRQPKVGLVVQGLLRSFQKNERGHEITSLFAWEGQFIGAYTTLLFHQPATETSQALEPSKMLVIDFPQLKKLADSKLVFARIYNQTLETLLAEAIQRAHDFILRNPEQRFKQLQEKQAFLLHRAPMKHLATYLGITAGSLSRIKKRASKTELNLS